MAMVEENNANLPLQEHPLLNSVVLKQVFEYLKPSSNVNLDLDTLKSIRQVCTFWRDESLGWWRETAVLNLTPEMIDDPELATVTQLLEEKPLQKYKLEDSTVDVVKCFEAGTQANRFWNTVGPHVKHLTLEGVNFRCGVIKQKLVQEPTLMQFLVNLLPNLSTLVVNDVTLNGKKFRGKFLQDDKSFEILQHPNVVSLTCSSFNYFVFKNFPNLQYLALDNSESLFGMLREMDGSNLKHLDLVVPEKATLQHSDGTLRIIRGTKFPCLERLSIKFCKDRHNSGCKLLPELLKNHCEHLKILEVNCKPWILPFYRFPFNCQLNQLTELRLWGNVVTDLSFLNWTPKLKLLHIDQFGLEKLDDFYNEYPADFCNNFGFSLVRGVKKHIMEGVVLNDLEYLQINCDPESESLSLKELKTLGEWMPNLKTLRTILQRGSIAVICDQWPLLEHLAGMFGSKLTDKDITGTRKQGGKGLPDLAELKTFHLNLGCQDGRLTDVAAHSGFLKMKKLTDLQVSVGDEFSEDAKELLEDRFQNAVITGNHYGKHDWAGDDEDECCRNTTFMDFMHEELGDNLWGNNYYSSSEDDDMDEFNHQSEDEEDEEEEVVSQESQDNEKEQDGDDEKEQQ